MTLPLIRLPIPAPKTRPVTLPAVHDRVTFTAPCPDCARPAEWVATRNDTRVRHAIQCGCGGAA